MSIYLNWPSQASAALDAIEVYRATSLIDLTNPGTPIAILPGDATEFTDESVVENENYYYSLGAVKNGNRTMSVTRNVPYLAKVGVLADSIKITRGEFDTYYLGQLTNNAMTDLAGLKGLMPDVAGLFVTAITSWHKYLYKGKILYIPYPGPVTASFTALNNAGLVFGENDPLKLPAHAAAAVDHKRIITIGEHEYIVRLLRTSDLPFTDFVNSQDKTAGSEYRDTIARMTTATKHASTSQYAKPRLSDWTATLQALSGHLFSAGNSAMMSGAANEHEYVKAQPIATAAATLIVLELIP